MDEPKLSTIQSVSTAELYDRWAHSYDTDGNILQAVDDAEIPSLLTTLFDLLSNNTQSSSTASNSQWRIKTKIKITDFGCGTGRNTAKLLNPTVSPVVEIAQVHALDLSKEMLKIARRSCQGPSASVEPDTAPQSDIQVPPRPRAAFQQFNALDEMQSLPAGVAGSDAVISTLVLEHLPLCEFFVTVSRMLRLGGCLLLTNMHDEMGRRSQAGFADVEAETGAKVKIQGESFVYGVEEVVATAEEFGFRLVGEMRERGITEGDLEAIGVRGRKWVGCRVWFGGIFRFEGR